MLKTNVAKSVLAERTLRYWQASASWNGIVESMSLKKQNDLLQGALDHGNSGSKLYDKTCVQLDRTIKYGPKPKNGLKRYKKNEVVQMKRKANGKA